jgi:ABC-type glycerol-3-phosphate transport system substrate-binding protein
VNAGDKEYPVVSQLMTGRFEAKDEGRTTNCGGQVIRPSSFVFRRWPMYLLLFIALLLAGCGGGRATPTPEPITINFAVREKIADYQALATDFQLSHPGILINLIDIDIFRGEGIAAIDTMEVDAVRWGTDYLTAERIEQIVPLDEVLEADDKLSGPDLYPGALKALQLQGVQLGVPAGIDFAVGYYNAPRFKNASVTPPAVDWTQDDLLADATAVNSTGDANAVNFTYGFCSLPNGADPVYFTYLFGGRLFDGLPEPTAPTFNEPANVEAIQWYTSLRTEYGVTPDPDEIRRAFRRGLLYEAIIRGKCGLWFGQFSDRGGKAWPSEWEAEGVMLPLPRIRAPFALLQVDGYYILEQSKHRKEAWDWVRFLLDHQEAAGFMLPPFQSQTISSEYAGRVGKDVAAVARLLSTTAIVLPAGADPILEQSIALYVGAIDKVLSGEMDVETALNDAQVQAEALFAPRE